MTTGQQLEEVLSWRVMAEMCRRFPSRFHLIEAHPGGGLYDCLALLTKKPSPKFAISITRGGSLHIHKEAFGLDGGMVSYSDWLDRMLREPPQTLLDSIADETRMKIPAKLPPSQPATLIYRYIAEFLTHSIGTLDYWECRNGFEDSSGSVGGIRQEFFDMFPDLQNEDNLRCGPMMYDSYAYNYWFLLKNQEPMLCMDTSGRMYFRSASSVELTKLYRRNRKIWFLIHQTALDYLP